MSTLKIEQTDNITVLSGNLTFDFNKMMNELSDNPHCMFGKIALEDGVLVLPDGSRIAEMKSKDMLDLFTNGSTDAYYQDRNVWCYLCVRCDLKNYMFAPCDSENRDNEYNRLRRGVGSFSEKGFKIYLMH